MEKLTDTDTDTDINNQVNTDTDTDIDLDSLDDEQFSAYMNKVLQSETDVNDTLDNNDSTNTTDTDTDTSSNNITDDTDTEPDSNDNTTNTNDNDIDNTVSNYTKPEENDNKTDTKSIVDKEQLDNLVSTLFSDGIKANGKTYTFKSADEIIPILQKGLNYSKKMGNIKNYQKQIQSLYSAGINSLEELNFAIDLYKGNPEALKTLFKNKQIDAMDLSDTDNISYNKSVNNIISDSDANYYTVLEDVKEQDYYPKLYDVLQNKWDNESKNKILQDGKSLKAFSDEFALGRFDAVNDIVEEQRAFGNLIGLNSLDEYLYCLNIYKERIAEKVNKLTKPKNIESKPKDIDVNKSSVIATKYTTSNNENTDILSMEDIDKMDDNQFENWFNNNIINKK